MARDPDKFMKRQQVNEENGRNPAQDQKAKLLNINELAFHEWAGEWWEKKMLKMQDDPDELLKTKGEKFWGTYDPNAFLKINELYKNADEAGMLLIIKVIYAEYGCKQFFSPHFPRRLKWKGGASRGC